MIITWVGKAIMTRKGEAEREREREKGRIRKEHEIVCDYQSSITKLRTVRDRREGKLLFCVLHD